MTIINDDSRVISKLETSLTDSARVVIYDRHMFTVQDTPYLSVESVTKKKVLYNLAQVFAPIHIFKIIFAVHS
jgi:hypothetical protein